MYVSVSCKSCVVVRFCGVVLVCSRCVRCNFIPTMQSNVSLNGNNVLATKMLQPYIKFPKSLRKHGSSCSSPRILPKRCKHMFARMFFILSRFPRCCHVFHIFEVLGGPGPQPAPLLAPPTRRAASKIVHICIYTYTRPGPKNNKRGQRKNSEPSIYF